MNIFKETITAVDLRLCHINNKPYRTDQSYTKVARELQKIITKKKGFLLLDQYAIKDIAIKLALHLEDTVADAGIWRSFCTRHKKIYGTHLPFQWKYNDIPLDEVSPQSCSFIIWMTLTNYEDTDFISPLLPDIDELGTETYKYLSSIFYDIEINEEMLKNLYSDKTLSDFYNVKYILSWLSDSEGCYLSDSTVTHVNKEATLNHTLDFFSSVKKIDYNQIEYHVDSTFPFSEKVGPLALLAHEWFADMIEGHNNENTKRYVDIVRQIKYKPFNTFKIISSDSETITLLCTNEEKIKIAKDGFGYYSEEDIENSSTITGSFVFYNGIWQVTGFALFSKSDKDFDKMINKNKEDALLLQNTIETHKKVIDQNNGYRHFYFHNYDEIKAWHDNIKIPIGNLTNETFLNNKEIYIYIQKNGNISYISDIAYALYDKNNPFYNEELTKKQGISVLERFDVNSECIQYIIENGMLKNIEFKWGDDEESKKLIQENIDFLFKFYHRGHL